MDLTVNFPDWIVAASKILGHLLLSGINSTRFLPDALVLHQATVKQQGHQVRAPDPFHCMK
jgi:hypothetical protein